MADTRKSLVFQARIDTSELPQAVESIKRMMNQSGIASSMGKQGMSGIVPMPKSEDIAKARRELELTIRTTAQAYEKNIRNLQQEERIAKSLQNIRRDDLKGKTEQDKYDNRVLQNLEKRLRLTEEIKNQEKFIPQGLQALGGAGGGGPGMMKQLIQGIGIPTTIAGIATAVVTAMSQLPSLPRQIAVATGAATQGLLGNQLQGLQGGEMIKTMAFRPEWRNALEQARKERENPITELKQRLTTSTGLMTMVLPAMLGPLGAIIGSHGRPEQAFQAQQMQLQMENAQSVYQANMQNDPRKMAAVNMYQQNFMRDLQAQRMMGLSDQGYFGGGGFQERMNNAGFNPELGLGMAAQIQAGGGSTRGMRGLSNLGLQSQRGFDMTNAGGVLGRISGTAGGDESSRQIFRKLMEESIKAGLDKSEFREEQRRFTDAASEVLAGAGVKTAADAAQVLAGFSRFLPGGEMTVKGIEGARGAYEQAQAISSQTGGRMGALQSAAMQQNPRLRKMGYGGFGEFMEMPEKDLIASNPDIIAAAREVGMTAGELAGTLRTAKRQSMLSAMGLNQQEVDEFANSQEGRSFNPSDPKSVAGLSKKHFETWRKIQKQVPFLFPYKSSQEKTAAEMGVLGRGPSGGTGDYFSTLIAGTDRMADTAVAASGTVSQQFLESFREFRDVMVPSKDAVSEWTKMLMMSATVLRFTAEGDRASAQKALSDMMGKSSKKTQDQVTR
jgi:hypothetical protein